MAKLVSADKLSLSVIECAISCAVICVLASSCNPFGIIISDLPFEVTIAPKPFSRILLIVFKSLSLALWFLV